MAKETPKETKETPKPVIKYVSKFRVFHPYQKVYISDIPVIVEMDSWLQCQIEAGIVNVAE